MRGSAKFHADIAVHFLAIANIRERGVKRPPPGQARGVALTVIRQNEYIFLDDTGKLNIYIESFQTNACTRPLGRVHEFDLKTRDINISSRLSPRFNFLCV